MTGIQCLNEQVALSAINNHLPLTMSLLHVSASTRPSTGRLHTAHSVTDVPVYIYNTILSVNPLKAELNPICHLLALLGAHHILHVSRIRVKTDKKNLKCQ
jgi:hypothetical protein